MCPPLHQDTLALLIVIMLVVSAVNLTVHVILDLTRPLHEHVAARRFSLTATGKTSKNDFAAKLTALYCKVRDDSKVGVVGHEEGIPGNAVAPISDRHYSSS